MFLSAIAFLLLDSDSKHENAQINTELFHERKPIRCSVIIRLLHSFLKNNLLVVGLRDLLDESQATLQRSNNRMTLCSASSTNNNCPCHMTRTSLEPWIQRLNAATLANCYPTLPLRELRCFSYGNTCSHRVMGKHLCIDYTLKEVSIEENIVSSTQSAFDKFVLRKFC